MATLVSKFASEHADTFRFIAAFTGKLKSPQIYDTMMAFFKLVDPHFRLRRMIDSFEKEPPYYDTVHKWPASNRFRMGSSTSKASLSFKYA